MAIRLEYPVDELQLDALIAEGWTTLTLWYANSPNGSYQLAAPVTITPATLAAASTSKTYTFVIDFPNGSEAWWYRVRAYDGSTYSPLSAASPIHGGGGTTLEMLRKKLGHLIDDIVSGTTTANGTATTFVCNQPDVGRANDNHYVGRIFVRNDTGAWAMITAWDRATRTGTLDTSVGTVGSGVAFDIFSRHTPEEYRQAINNAIIESYPVLSRTIVTTSLRAVKDRFRYQVPGDIRTVTKVEIENPTFGSSSSPDTRGHPWRELAFETVEDDLITYIEVKEQLTWADEGRRLRVTGTGPLSQLYNDSDYVEVLDPQVQLILYKAANYLYTRLINGAASSDVDRYQSLAKYYLNLFEATKDQYGRPRPPLRMWGHDAKRVNVAAREWRFQR